MAILNTPSIIQLRSANPDLKRALMGGLLTLDDTQVRDRPGRGDSRYDSTDARGKVEWNLPGVTDALTTSAWIPIRNRAGEWSTEVHLRPLQWFSDRALVTTPDSNPFVPAATAYPLFLFQEDRGTPDIVAQMRDQAIENVRSYRSPGGGYNFWPRREDAVGVKPYNLPVEALEWPLVGKWMVGAGLGPKAWIERVLDPQQNPHGLSQLTNIPDDADDTAIAVAVLELQRRAGKGQGDVASLDRLPLHRDLQRTTPRVPDEQWQGSNTGAYLTWLAPELSNPFANPAGGVLPCGQNDVGPVVNSNVLLALGLCGRTDLPGYADAVNLVVRTIEEKRWQDGTRYYPQPAVFPYCLSRAYREGQLSDPQLSQALPVLLQDILTQQLPDGSFPGGKEDQTSALSTSMSLVALMNLGRDLAPDSAAFDRALEKGVAYLIRSGRPYPLKHFDTFQRQGGSPGERKGVTWDPGIFFSGSPFGGFWRSQGYTVGVVVEALAKYLTATDLGGPQRKIHPLQYALSEELAPQEFRFEVDGSTPGSCNRPIGAESLA